MNPLQRLQTRRRRYGLRRAVARTISLWKNRLVSPSTIGSLREELQDLGLRVGELVLVHSAFSKVGYVRGGPGALIDALHVAIGGEGSVMMPSFPFNDPALDYAARGLTFDVGSTPSTVGQLQEAFRRRPGVKRSLHPTHPFCAAGPMADQLLAGHDKVLNPFGRESPLGRFVAAGGKCLMIGVGLKNCSPLRVVEDRPDYPHPVFHPEVIELKVRDYSGIESTVRTLVHSKDLAPLRRAENLREPLEAEGLLTRGRLGLAETLVLDCRGLLPVLERLLVRGVTPYSHLDKERTDKG